MRYDITELETFSPEFFLATRCSSASVRETVILNVTGTSSLSILNALNVSLFYRMIHRNLNI